MSYVVAVVGATGAVGREMLRPSSSGSFPVKRLVALASSEARGRSSPFAGARSRSRSSTPASFDGRRHRALQRGRQRLARVRAHRRARGRGRHRQLERLAHGPRRPAGRARGEHGGGGAPAARASSPTPTARPSRWSSRSSRCTTPRASSTSSCRRTRRRAARATPPSRSCTRRRARILEGRAPQAKVFPGPIAMNVLCDWKAGDGRLLRGGDEDGARDAQDPGRREHRRLADDGARAGGQRAHRVGARAVPPPDDRGGGEGPPRGAPGVVLMEEPYAPGKHPQPLQASGTDAVFVGPGARRSRGARARSTCGWWPTTCARARRSTRCKSPSGSEVPPTNVVVLLARRLRA